MMLEKPLIEELTIWDESVLMMTHQIIFDQDDDEALMVALKQIMKD